MVVVIFKQTGQAFIPLDVSSPSLYAMNDYLIIIFCCGKKSTTKERRRRKSPITIHAISHLVATKPNLKNGAI